MDVLFSYYQQTAAKKEYRLYSFLAACFLEDGKKDILGKFEIQKFRFLLTLKLLGYGDYDFKFCQRQKSGKLIKLDIIVIM